MSALTFAQPALLWGLGLIPVLWLILRALPPKIREITFPGFIFLEGLTSGREVPHKAPWWLVLLRVMIIACIIIGLARPVYDAAKAPDREDPLLIVIDNGWLTAAGWSDRQTSLQRWAHELEGSSRQIYLITTSADPLAPPAPDIPEPITAIELEQFARRVTPSALAADYTQARAPLEALVSSLSGRKMEIRWLSNDLIPATDKDAYAAFAKTLQQGGKVTIWRAPPRVHYFIAAATTTATGLKINVKRSAGRAGSPLMAATPQITAFAITGVPLSSTNITFEADITEASVDLRLPVRLANRVAYVQLDIQPGAGSIHLLDARNRRADTGLVTATDTENDTLLDASYYLTKALEPFTRLRRLDLAAGGEIEQDVVIFDDQGRLPASVTEKVANWVTEGGILVQFAGPRLADSIGTVANPGSDRLRALLPTRLRPAGRSFGGALSWQSAQALGNFAPESPLGPLTPDENVRIDRQLLVDPSDLAQAQIWASLEDGTPLVTARESGNGLMVFFHVAAAPGWSTLPLSQNFVDMLRIIAELATVSQGRIDPDQRFAPRLYLDGFGRLKAVPQAAKPVAGQDIKQGPSLAFPPGYYGDITASIAVNAVPDDLTLTRPPLGRLTDIRLRDYEANRTRLLASWLFLTALILFLIDSGLSLFLRGSLQRGEAGLPGFLRGVLPQLLRREVRHSMNVSALLSIAMTVALTVAVAMTAPVAAADPPATRANSQIQRNIQTPLDLQKPLDPTKQPDTRAQLNSQARPDDRTTEPTSIQTPPIEPTNIVTSPTQRKASPTQRQDSQEKGIDLRAIEASTQTRFAYIATQDPQIDRISRLGLEWLSRQLKRRTSLEPATPHEIILETPTASADILSLYPVIYWPVTPQTVTPSREQLAAFEDFMDNGGLLVIDTQDGEARSLGLATPQSEILRSILLEMNIPPLAPVPTQHALRRSFYLLDNFPGRNTGGAVWVEAPSTPGSRPAGVTPLIISGRDWAAAWAHDSSGTPVRSMPLGSGRQRELSIRAGINIVMIALTGNYKIDQLHVDQLLDNLESEDR